MPKTTDEPIKANYGAKPIDNLGKIVRSVNTLVKEKIEIVRLIIDVTMRFR